MFQSRNDSSYNLIALLILLYGVAGNSAEHADLKKYKSLGRDARAQALDLEQNSARWRYDDGGDTDLKHIGLKQRQEVQKQRADSLRNYWKEELLGFLQPENEDANPEHSENIFNTPLPAKSNTDQSSPLKSLNKLKQSQTSGFENDPPGNLDGALNMPSDETKSQGFLMESSEPASGVHPSADQLFRLESHSPVNNPGLTIILRRDKPKLRHGHFKKTHHQAGQSQPRQGLGKGNQQKMKSRPLHQSRINTNPGKMSDSPERSSSKEIPSNDAHRKKVGKGLTQQDYQHQLSIHPKDSTLLAPTARTIIQKQRNFRPKEKSLEINQKKGFKENFPLKDFFEIYINHYEKPIEVPVNSKKVDRSAKTLGSNSLKNSEGQKENDMQTESQGLTEADRFSQMETVQQMSKKLDLIRQVENPDFSPTPTRNEVEMHEPTQPMVMPHKPNNTFLSLKKQEDISDLAIKALQSNFMAEEMAKLINRSSQVKILNSTNLETVQSQQRSFVKNTTEVKRMFASTKEPQTLTSQPAPETVAVIQPPRNDRSEVLLILIILLLLIALGVAIAFCVTKRLKKTKRTGGRRKSIGYLPLSQKNQDSSATPRSRQAGGQPRAKTDSPLHSGSQEGDGHYQNLTFQESAEFQSMADRGWNTAQTVPKRREDADSVETEESIAPESFISSDEDWKSDTEESLVKDNLEAVDQSLLEPKYLRDSGSKDGSPQKEEPEEKTPFLHEIKTDSTAEGQELSSSRTEVTSPKEIESQSSSVCSTETTLRKPLKKSVFASIKPSSSETSADKKIAEKPLKQFEFLTIKPQLSSHETIPNQKTDFSTDPYFSEIIIPIEYRLSTKDDF